MEISTDNTVKDLERRVAEAFAEGRKDAAIEDVFTLVGLVSDRRMGSAAAALFPYVMTVCSGDRRARSATENLKHAIMHYDPVTGGGKLSDHVMVETGNVAYVAVKLLEGGVLSAGEYILLMERLGEVLADPEADRIVSVLHLLQERNAALVQRALVFMSRDTGIPLLPLSRFWPQPDAFRGLPADYAATRGAFAFDQMEDALLVAILNPYDESLRTEVQWQEEQKCLFYLVAPAEYDSALKLLREATAT